MRSKRAQSQKSLTSSPRRSKTTGVYSARVALGGWKQAKQGHRALLPAGVDKTGAETAKRNSGPFLAICERPGQVGGDLFHG